MVWEESVSVGWVYVDSLAEYEHVHPIYQNFMLHFLTRDLTGLEVSEGCGVC